MSREKVTVNLTLKQLVYIFNHEFENHKQGNDTKGDFYCGITHDLEERNRGHKIDGSEIVCRINTSSFEDAKAVEAALEHEGYRTGELGHGINKTKIVYMFRLTETSDPKRRSE